MNELTLGFKLEKQFMSPETVQRLIDEIPISGSQQSFHGIRNAEKKFECIVELIHSEKILAKARSILGNEPQLVRAMFFDKNPEKNWLVSWHQDKTVSVNKKKHIDGWGPWSLKDNTHHVQPSEYVLNNMITFRIHLDDANVDNGCLKVIPHSHSRGVLTQKEVDDIVKEAKFVECVAQAGDMLIMRPLILHASSKAISPSHRRVIHIEFSGYNLPGDLCWE